MGHQEEGLDRVESKIKILVLALEWIGSDQVGKIEKFVLIFRLGKFLHICLGG